jgi:hypothetical protein
MRHDPSHKIKRAPLALALIFAASLCASAQTAARDDVSAAPEASPSPAAQTSPTPGTSPTPSPAPSPRNDHRSSLERDFLKNVLRDQRAIWTSPFRLGRGDARRLAPLAISTAALLATDQETDEFGQSVGRANVSRDVSLAGSVYSTGGVAAAFYLVGRAAHNARARETGLLGGEALIDGGVVFSVLKNVTQRQRPDHDEGQGEFFERGHSFPSGHATSAWALATVVANEYKGHRAVEIAAYGLAAAVSASRYTGRNHFLSDVLVGSAIGYGTGRYVYHAHHDKALDAGGGDASVREKSRLLPRFAPEYDPRARLYGVALAWSF